MIKQSKSPKLFAFKMIGVMIALSMVIYACSGPMEDQLTGNIKKVEPVNVNLKADSISVATFWNPKDTDIQFAVTLVEKSSTRLDVFDRNNQLVQTFMEGEFDKGSYLVTWSPEKNKKIPAGTYTYKLSVNDNHVDGNFTYGEALELPIPPKGEDVFTVVEEMPQFPGGNEALIDYLVKNVVYPKEAKDNNISGRVFVSFVVEKDGSIGDVKILRGIGGGCDEESVRVVSSMPKWIPGKQNGKPVRVAYNLPIKYALN